MRLTDLDASFVSTATGPAVAVQFRCPGCQAERIVIPFANPIGEGVADPSMNHRGVLWQRSGETLESLTLTPSVDFTHVDRVSGFKCTWHGWVTNGEISDA